MDLGYQARRGLSGEISASGAATPLEKMAPIRHELIAAHKAQVSSLEQSEIPPGQRRESLIRNELALSFETEHGVGTYTMELETYITNNPTQGFPPLKHDKPLRPPDFSELCGLAANWLDAGLPLLRLPIHVQMRELVTEWLEEWWQYRDKYPFVWALVPLDAALRYTHEPDIDADMARLLVDLIQQLRLDMSVEQAQRVGVDLNSACFAMWPQSTATAETPDSGGN